jgi:RHS repeat-associated protein
VARYTQTTNIDEPLAESRSGTTSYHEADGLGSITSLTASNGSIGQSYTYDSFGNQTNSSGSLRNYFRYTAREFDTETNLYFNRARYYDPSVGRFTSEDLVRFGGGDANFYSYVGQNPTNYADPTGHTRYYGYWCGPDWTGGLREQYDPKHAGMYHAPKDDVDEVCMHHDICYFNCRSKFPCGPGGRSNCMTKCDQIFVATMPLDQGRGLQGLAADLLTSGIFWHQFAPDPGPNASGCCISGNPPPPQLSRCVGFSCLDNK